MSSERSPMSWSSSPMSKDVSTAEPSEALSGLLAGSAAEGATFGEKLGSG